MIDKKQCRYALKLLRKLFSLPIIKAITIASLAIIVVPLVFIFLSKPKPVEHITYGINFSHRYANDLGLDWKKAYIEILEELRPEYARLVIYWDEVEQFPGNYDYSNIIWQLEEAKKQNVKVVLTMGRKVLRYPECFEPLWWKQIPSKEQKETALVDYIENIVLTLKGYSNITMWQVENEPFFPFGDCEKSYKSTIEKEIAMVRSLDSRPVLTQDSGEGGFWLPTYQMGDYLGISMYRRIWYDFWKIFFGKSIYFKYPLAHWTYKIKANVTQVPMDKIIVTELQAEPWGPTINSKLTDDEKRRTMSKQHFIDTINYAQKSGFSKLYFWGVEWWLWEKDVNNNPFYWETGKAIIRN